MKFNLAERRCWGARFLRIAGDVCGLELAAAAEAFLKIHDKMWEVDRLTGGELSGPGIAMDIRRQVADILKECREFDLEAAECIGNAIK